MRTETVVVLLLVALTGCKASYIDLYSCVDPDKGHKDAKGEPDPCHLNDPDAGDAGNAVDAGDAGDEDGAGDAEPPDAAGGTCPGVCAPFLPGEWLGPALFWMGAEADAPLCADVPGAPGEYYTGHADLDGPVCGTCTCDPPSGSCALPAMMTVSSGICYAAGPGVEQTPFGPPLKWDGNCTAANEIPAGKLCDGVPCAQSLTIAPLKMTQGGCLPIEPPKPLLPKWKTFTRACAANPSPQPCGTKAELCVPAPPTSEFRLCAMQKSAPNGVDCPPGYPNKNVFYNSSVDALACSPCTCGVPTGSTCKGSVSIFPDGVCGAPVFVTVSIDATGPQCTDIKPAGSALGSVSASAPIFTPGTCKATGGDLVQGSSPLISTVVCCQGMP